MVNSDTLCWVYNTYIGESWCFTPIDGPVSPFTESMADALSLNYEFVVSLVTELCLIKSISGHNINNSSAAVSCLVVFFAAWLSTGQYRRLYCIYIYVCVRVYAIAICLTAFVCLTDPSLALPFWCLVWGQVRHFHLILSLERSRFISFAFVIVPDQTIGIEIHRCSSPVCLCVYVFVRILIMLVTAVSLD